MSNPNNITYRENVVQALSEDTDIPRKEKVGYIYARPEQTGDASKYLLLPAHSVAIPYTKDIQAQLVQTLVSLEDVTSTQELSDYPVVTKSQLTQWFSSYTIQKRLVVVPVSKPKEICTGWELRRIEESVALGRSRGKLTKELQKLKDSKMYKLMTPEQQRTVRMRLLGEVW